MEDVGAMILLAWFSIATAITIQFVVVDYRDFDRVVKQCEKQGFIQDKAQRISCSLEKK